MSTFFEALKNCEKGVTGVEYGLLLSLIAMAVVGEVTSLGNAVGDHYGAIQGGIEYANTAN